MNWSGHQAAKRNLHAENGVSADRLFGAHTTKALANFAVRGPLLADHLELVRAVALVKIAAARANGELGELDEDTVTAIVAAAREILDGAHAEQFVLPVVQGGGGTSTNMNVNEVIARRASELLRERGIDRDVHPNDQVNRGQSTNDVMPTAIALAVHEVGLRTVAELDHLVATLHAKAAEYPRLQHLGRTCLQDAVALPVMEVHRSHAYGVEQASAHLRRCTTALLGGTAVGTGVGAREGFTELALAELSGYPVVGHEDRYFALASLEPLVAVSEAVDRCARTMARIGTDLRLLSSGPVGGIGEVELPAMQPGSSIMPGKVNPVIPELVMQISFQISGEATSARLAAIAGELEVSAMAPVVTLGLLAGLARLGSGARIFADRCIAGLRWNEAAVQANLAGAFTKAVVAATTEGYDAVARRRLNVVNSQE